MRVRTRCALSATLAIAASAGSAGAGIFEDRPDAVVCAAPGAGRIVFYVSQRHEGGAVVYRALVKEVVSISIATDGSVVTDRAFCAGETIDSLRKKGRAFDLE